MGGSERIEGKKRESKISSLSMSLKEACIVAVLRESVNADRRLCIVGG